MTSVILSPIALEDLEEICDYVILYRSHAAMKLAQQSLQESGVSMDELNAEIERLKAERSATEYPDCRAS